MALKECLQAVEFLLVTLGEFMTDIEELQEFTQADDPFFDFCLWEYEKQAGVTDKLRSINLLLHSFEIAVVDDRMLALCDAIRKGIGDWGTVWGVKQVAGKLSWELYFYDYQRTDRTVSVTRLLEILKNFTHCDLQVDEDCLYFMFSLDVDNDLLVGDRDLDEINIYIGNIGSTVSSGICYELSKDGMLLDNLYCFFDANREMQAIADKITSSVHVQCAALDLDQILLPELRSCRTIVVANKKHNDGIYFSGVDIDQLLYFLRELGYPVEIIAYVRDNRGRLDHMLYDVGIDYKMVNGTLEILKSSYYGVF